MKYLLIISILIVASLIYFSTSGKLIFKTIKWANEKYLSEYEIDLDNVDFHWTNKSLTEKNILIKSENFCFTYIKYKNCFEELVVDIDINLLTPKEFKVNQLSLKADELNFLLLESKKKEQEPSVIDIGSYLKVVKNVLSSVAVEKLKINLPKITIHQNNKSYNAAIVLDNKKSQKMLTGNAIFNNEALSLYSKLQINLRNEPEIDADFKLNMNDIEVASAFNLKFKQDEFKVSIDIKKVDVGKKYQVTNGNCETTFKYESDINLKCRDLNFTAYLERNLFFKIAVEARINNIINLQSEDNFLISEVKGHAEKENSFNLELESKVALAGSSSGIKPKLLKLEINAIIAKFSKLVAELAKTNFAIPAPFNNLNGSGKLTAKLDSSLNLYKFPLTGTLDLDEQKYTQLKLAIDSNLELTKDFKPKKFTGEVLVKSLKFYIPDIDPLFGIPEVRGTDKISETITFTKKEKSSLEYDFQIKTESINSIRIHNQFFEPYLSMSLLAKVSNDTSSFDIKVKDGSKIQYLKRQLEIKKIVLDKKKTSTLIDANFEYQASGYQIFLNIIGTIEKPRLILSSFPSLPREEIISLLLYNRKSNELTGFNRASVGSTENAISNRALGLFSIWAFASTPVDSVTYDSQTKTYNAVVSLPGGTSVMIGTDWDRLNNLSFRKRLSATWAVVTTFEPTETDSKETIMLQKEVNF